MAKLQPAKDELMKLMNELSEKYSNAMKEDKDFELAKSIYVQLRELKQQLNKMADEEDKDHSK